jgi:excinuclease ABC subunit C
MAEAAERCDFELAAIYRDRLRALTYIQGTQTVHAEGLGDADIFALAAKGGSMCIQAFFIRGGQNWGPPRLLPLAHQRGAGGRSAVELPDPVLRGHAAAPPILVDRDIAEAELVAEALCEKAGQEGADRAASARAIARS